MATGEFGTLIKWKGLSIKMGKMGTFKQFVEEISDDFQSTFTVVSDNVLQNLLKGPDEFDELIGVIRKYIPNARVSFRFIGDYGFKQMYLIELIDD